MIGTVFGASGVSSLSACSGDEAFSGPEEKSTSNGFLGVTKEGARYGDAGGLDEGRICEKRKGCEFGSRSAGVTCF